MEVPENIRDAGPRAVVHYKKMIRDGASHLFAEMCSLQCPPGVKGTDRAVMQGRYDSSWLDEMPKAQANRILREAKAAGIVTTGRYYMSGLADKRGHCDPKAWIDGAADIRRVAKERNLHVRGIVDYTPPEQPPPERPAISKRLERELVAKERRRNPRLSKGEAREMVIDKYAPSFKKKKT